MRHINQSQRIDLIWILIQTKEYKRTETTEEMWTLTGHSKEFFNRST